MIKSVLAATLAVAALSAPAAALAEESITVRIADLDLSQPAGRAALDRRIARASHAVCAAMIATDSMTRGTVKRCTAIIERDAQGRAQAAIAMAASRKALAER